MYRLAVFFLALTLLTSVGCPLLVGAHPGPRPTRAARTWRGFAGPPYLPAPLARRPGQHVLDSLAGCARRPAAPTTSRPR